MKSAKLNTPLDKKIISKLKIGDNVSLSGVLYTARDASCKLIKGLLDTDKKLPFDIKNQVIYFVGPTPAIGKRAIGSCGPTTAARMSRFIPLFFEEGLCAIIGKGRLPQYVRDFIKKYRGVYFLAIGGAGAILSRYVKKANVVAFKELGPEAIYKFEVDNFPLIVGIDSKGNDIYDRL